MRSLGERLRYTSGTESLLQVPFYHCFGWPLCTLVCLIHGAAIVVPAPSFDGASRLGGHRRRTLHGTVYGVPTMFVGGLERPPTLADMI